MEGGLIGFDGLVSLFLADEAGEDFPEFGLEGAIFIDLLLGAVLGDEEKFAGLDVEAG